MVNKKFVTMALCFLMIFFVAGCGKNRTFSIAVTDIVTDADFVYADEEISPTGNRITVYSSESMGDAEILLKPAEVKEENVYEPILLKAGKSVTINVEKDAWFKVGIRMTDPTKAGKKTLKIKGITVRIASDTDDEGETYVITEEIKEINGTVMKIDGPDGCFNVPMENMEASPEPQVGDILEVVYDGRIEELYPSLFPGIFSLKVYKPVEMTAVIADIGTYNNLDALYFNPVEFSSLNNCIVTDWKKYIPTGGSFEAGDEITITYTGNVEEDNPAVLSGVVKIALTDEGFKRKYGDFINETYEPNSAGNTCICIDGVTYYDTGKETSLGARPVDNSIQIEYVEIPVGGKGVSGTITAFTRIEEGKTLACLIGEKWYLFESRSDLPGELNVSDGNAGTIREDVCELYLEVLEDLWNVDSGLNSEISQIGIDLSELSHLTEVEKDTVMSEFASKHKLPFVAGTFEELCEQGFIDKKNLYWEDGLFFSIKTNEEAEWNLPNIKEGDSVPELTSFDAQKWRGGLGAYFFGQCTAQKDADGTWSYTVGQEAIA